MERIGSALSPDVFGTKRELTLTFTWDTAEMPPEVYAIVRAFQSGDPVSVGFGPDGIVTYSPIDLSQSLASRPNALTARMRRIDES